MLWMVRRFASALLVTAALSLVAGCGDEHRAPTALSQSLAVTEDQPLQGRLAAVSIQEKVTFRIVVQPRHGQLQVDPESGAFQYTPDADYFGEDSFTFVAATRRQSSQAAPMTLHVQPVNDAPRPDAIPNLQNSAYERDIHYTVGAYDVEGDRVQLTPFVDDPAIARVSLDAASNELTIEPLGRGTTQVTIEASDGKDTGRTQFAFSVGDVTKIAKQDAGPERDHAVLLVNDSDRTIPFNLSHNAFPLMDSDEQMVEYVRAMPSVFADEPFERKLWRFVRDNVYHWPPLSADQWISDPWMVISSLGWGFCGEVSAAYVRLAQAAGYEARVRGLSGHVVPEIRIGERWQMFDPDLALYYRTRPGEIASVDDLVADPTLITAPTDPVLDTVANPLPYSDFVASIYASTADNYVADSVFVTLAAGARPPLTLPPGAEFVYPGRWTDAPSGFDGDTPYEVPAFEQGSLITPSGWTGSVPLPFRLAAVQGEGRVRIGALELVIGSPQLDEALRGNPLEYDHVEILEARSPVRLVVYMNALRYVLEPTNDLELRGQDVWAIQVNRIELPVQNKSAGNAVAYAKPLPIRR
jgi:hypothetical protein